MHGPCRSSKEVFVVRNFEPKILYISTHLPFQNVEEAVWQTRVEVITNHSHCSRSSTGLMAAVRNSKYI